MSSRPGPGHSNTVASPAPLRIEQKDFDLFLWRNVMHKGHMLAQQRIQQESELDIQAEIEVEHLLYPQSFIELKQKLMQLKKHQTLKIKTGTMSIKQDLSAAARLLECRIEDVLNEQYLYITRT